MATASTNRTAPGTATNASTNGSSSPGRRSPSAQSWSPPRLSTLLNPFAMARATWSTATTVLGAARALPRIAGSLERIGSTETHLRELTRLRATLDRLEKLGLFLAEELPEIGHQLEAVHRRLEASGSEREATERLEHTERQLRDAIGSMRALTESLRTTADQPTRRVAGEQHAVSRPNSR
ncbi:hypothetical protein [Sciscionella sediminilitoris]|uniref:hypothetical protein n=1 Tax=Sciscionella sediminilitoris TaxID=1445613 RepID=UPI0012E17F40|nr:hypothetical protein [Sciscionella sp. SE31]